MLLLRFVSCGRVTKETESNTASRRLPTITSLDISFSFSFSSTLERARAWATRVTRPSFSISRPEPGRGPPASLGGLMRDRLRIAQGIHRREMTRRKRDTFPVRTPRLMRVRARENRKSARDHACMRGRTPPARWGGYTDCLKPPSRPQPC